MLDEIFYVVGQEEGTSAFFRYGLQAKGYAKDIGGTCYRYVPESKLGDRDKHIALLKEEIERLTRAYLRYEYEAILNGNRLGTVEKAARLLVMAAHRDSWPIRDHGYFKELESAVERQTLECEARDPEATAVKCQKAVDHRGPHEGLSPGGTHCVWSE